MVYQKHPKANYCLFRVIPDSLKTRDRLLSFGINMEADYAVSGEKPENRDRLFF